MDFLTAKNSQGVVGVPTGAPRTPREVISYLRTTTAIRDRCQDLFNIVEAGKSDYFELDLSQLGKVADYVIEVMREEYPDLNVPFHSRWRHFEVSGISRISRIDQIMAKATPLQKAATKYDLAIVSVLLDAGAGEKWSYHEHDTGLILKRSEGLAVATLQMFIDGTFSSNPHQPLQVDASKLISLTLQELARGFQATLENSSENPPKQPLQNTSENLTENPLVGIDGRLKLLQKLGSALAASPNLFGQDNPRPGNLVSYLQNQVTNNQLEATTVLQAVLEGFSSIWSGRLDLDGINLGDIWYHPAVIDDGLVPFHKLSQWLTYSLLEPLEELGIKIIGLESLTGLPEYRNGGLFIDLGLIKPKYPEILQQSHSVASAVIVEWRALTVILLDIIATTIRTQLNMDSQQLPLVKILQGGTWTAGRKIAAKLRKNGIPPIDIESDGTVF